MERFIITNVLAATDLSDSSLPALRYARLFADRFKANLTVMYAEPILYAADLGAAELPYLLDSPEHRETLRAEIVRQAAPIMEGRPYNVEADVANPVSGILAAARDRRADLVVVGTHLRQGWRRAILGSVSDAVLHGSDSAVLAVAGREHATGTPEKISRILCPVNFTDVARESLRAAASLAEVFAAQLTIVHVLEPDEVMNVEADEERVRLWIEPELQGICSYRELTVRGGAAERVLDCADDLGADLVVVGAQHKLFRDATVIGETTERIIRFASCPVLVVPRAAVPAAKPEKREQVAIAAP